MSIHPARIVASVLLIAGGVFVGVTALGDRAWPKLLVAAGDRRHARPTPLLLRTSIPVLPFIVALRRRQRRRGVGLARRRALGGRPGHRDGDRRRRRRRRSADPAHVVGRDPFASTASARSTADGIGIVGAFTVLYLVVIVAVAVARLPRHPSHRRQGVIA